MLECKQDLIDKVEKIGIENLSVIVTVVELPSGAKEVLVNYQKLPEKISYLKDAYNDNLTLKTKEDIILLDCIIL
jgi:hypothetical protein